MHKITIDCILNIHKKKTKNKIIIFKQNKLTHAKYQIFIAKDSQEFQIIIIKLIIIFMMKIRITKKELIFANF